MKKNESIGYNHQLPTAIRKSIAAKGITQAALAAAVGLQPGTISNYCNGERTPDAVVLEKIAKVLDVTPNDLLGIETGGKPSSKHAPEKITLETCADAARMLEALLDAFSDSASFDLSKRTVVDEYFDQGSGNMRYREYDVDSVTFTFNVSGLVKYFEGIKKMDELQKQMPDVFETFKETMRDGLIKRAEKEPVFSVDYEELPF
ncbi:MAG: helix-turn-helix transcriptional regulator [Clostridiales bacterium]|nr:helix-turn-helix transcriptional regulator [Clostridiales bacterium]